MSANTQERNLQYFGYLLNIGLLDDTQHQNVALKCAKKDEKGILYEISNVFSKLTPADWFDLSCRIYNSWNLDSNNQSRDEDLQTRTNPSYRPTNGKPQETGQPSVNMFTVDKSHAKDSVDRWGTKDHEQESSKRNGANSYPDSSPDLGSKSTDVLPSPAVFEKFKIKNKLSRMFDILKFVGTKKNFSHLKNHYQYQKLILNTYNVTPTKTGASPQSEKYSNSK